MTLLSLPSTAAAATAMCSSELGSCEVSNDNGDFVFCECEGGDQLGGTGGSEWDGLSENELHEICLNELASCDIGETTTGGETEGQTTTVGETEGSGGETDPTTEGETDPTTGESESHTTVGEPTKGDTEDPTGDTVDPGESESEGTTTTNGDTDGSDSFGTDTTGGDSNGQTSTGTNETSSGDPETGIGETGDEDSDGDAGNNDDKMGCSIAMTPKSAGFLSLGLLLAVTGIRRRRE